MILLDMLDSLRMNSDAGDRILAERAWQPSQSDAPDTIKLPRIGAGLGGGTLIFSLRDYHPCNLPLATWFLAYSLPLSLILIDVCAATLNSRSPALICSKF